MPRNFSPSFLMCGKKKVVVGKKRGDEVEGATTAGNDKGEEPTS